MELVLNSISYFLVVLVLLVGVAFTTLLERKILGSSQIRLGPSHVGYLGLMQPFSDAIKLFTKETFVLRSVSSMVYLVSPIMAIFLMLVIWLLYPFFSELIIFSFGLMFFICVSGVGVYPIISSGWASNCKYSLLGSLRSVAQMISYEVSLVMILLSLIWLSDSFNFKDIVNNQNELVYMVMFLPLGMVWLVSSLAETNRTPYDFSEGESELVSGFNTEYGSWGFGLIFMAEYGNIMFMSLVFCVLFIGFMSVIFFECMLLVFWFVWVRSTLPRYRYDKLMSLAWKSFLPVALFLFLVYLFVKFVIIIC